MTTSARYHLVFYFSLRYIICIRPSYLEVSPPPPTLLPSSQFYYYVLLPLIPPLYYYFFLRRRSFDAQVKAMEIDERPTEDYNDIGGESRIIDMYIRDNPKQALLLWGRGTERSTAVVPAGRRDRRRGLAWWFPLSLPWEPSPVKKKKKVNLKGAVIILHSFNLWGCIIAILEVGVGYALAICTLEMMGGGV